MFQQVLIQVQFIQGDIRMNTGDDFEFNLPTDNNRKFKGFDNNGVRLQNTSGGWAMEYGFLGSGGTDLGGFGGHGGTGLTKFYIGRRYDRPLVSFFSGSSNDGVLIGHFDNTEGAPKTLTVQGDISSSGHIHLENQKAIFFRTNNATSYISSSGDLLKLYRLVPISKFDSAIRCDTSNPTPRTSVM